MSAYAGSGSGQRDQWQFEYTAAEIHQAALVKQTHHNDRLKWWNAQRDIKFEEIRSKGISIDESQIASNHQNSSYGRQPSVLIDVSLQRDLDECNVKITEHRGKEADYSAWVEVLAGQTKALQLNQADWLFFFGQR